jgi:hypothetical protein
MAQNKLTMRQIQEILRLKHQNQLSVREIARSCGLPASTVGDYLKRAAAAGLSWHPFISDKERRFAPATVRQDRNGVRHGLEQVSAFIGIRIGAIGHVLSPFEEAIDSINDGRLTAIVKSLWHGFGLLS